MNRTIANVVIDLAAALLFAGMIATGYVLRFPLPPGTNRTLTLWSLTRHQWGSIHYGMSLGLLVIIAAHIVLHWKWLVTVAGKRLHLVGQKPSMVRSAVVITAVFAVAFGLFAFAVQWGVREMAQPLHELDGSIDPEAGETGSTDATTDNPAAPIDFRGEVYPIFAARCIGCHGPNRQIAGFRADQRAAYFSDSGQGPLITPGDSTRSALIDIVTGKSTQVRRLKEHQLPQDEVALLTAWIDAGAAWPEAQN